MMLSNHYPVTYSNAHVIPGVGHAGHHRRRAGPLFLQYVARRSRQGAVVGLVRRRRWRSGRRSGSAWPPRPACARRHRPWRRRRRPSIASVDLPKAPADVVNVVSTRCSMCHTPEPVFEGIGEAPKGVLLDTPEHIAAFAPAIRTQAVMTHAMPPNNITEMTPAGARRARPLAAGRESRAELKGLDMNDAAVSPGQKLMARLDEFAALQRRRRPSDAALSFQRPSARRRGNISPGAREIGLAAKIDASGNVWARYEGKAARRAGADDRLAYRHGARRRPL